MAIYGNPISVETRFFTCFSPPIYLAAVQAKPLKLLAVLLILMNFASLASVTASFLMLTFAPKLASRPYSWGYIGLYAMGLLLPFPSYYHMLDKRLRPQVAAGNAESFWRYLWAVPATFCAVYYYALYSNGGLRTFSGSWKNVLFLWVISAGSVLVTNLIAHLLEEGRENLRLQSENSQLALQTTQYESLRKGIEETRRVHHDLQHHMNAMKGYLGNGNLDKLRAYIETHTNGCRTFQQSGTVRIPWWILSSATMQEGWRRWKQKWN